MPWTGQPSQEERQRLLGAVNAVVAAGPSIPQSPNKQSTPNTAPVRASPSSWVQFLAKKETNTKSPIKSPATMSWAGFKKNVNRAATQVMVKTGHVEQTHDRSYEVEERRYRVMENAATRLQKESKGYLDSLRAMTASQMRIAETIDAFYGDAGANDGVSRSYKQAVEDLDAETIKALDGPFRATVLDPINRFCAYFPDINECIKKRNHKLLDYDRVRAQVKRLTEKPDKDVTKLPRTEKEAEMTRAAYEQLNEQLFSELPQLIELRVPYLDPSFEALVKIQLRFCAEAYSRMAQVQQYLDPDTRDQYANGNLDARVEQVLQEIRELSIAGTV
ncbi:BAR-domain-containing protein [Aureobasidium sp. EXF-10727]|nr:BAR-domain-containing protein [Aureobasidium sp. EXF-10727]KAI4726817.1 BAR-domain-containing protein [Aureobasidium sp. EXF-10728]